MFKYACDLGRLMDDEEMEVLRKQYSIPSEDKDKAAILMFKREKESYEREMAKINKRRDARFEYKGSAYMPMRKTIASTETYHLQCEQGRHDKAFSILCYYELNEKLKNGLKLLRLETYENKTAEQNKMMELTGLTQSIVKKFFKLIEANHNKTDANDGLTDKELRNIDKAKELGFDVRPSNSLISIENTGVLVDCAISGTLPENFKKKKVNESNIHKNKVDTHNIHISKKPSKKKKWKGITIIPKTLSSKEPNELGEFDDFDKFDKFDKLRKLIKVYESDSSINPIKQTKVNTSIKQSRRELSSLIQLRREMRKLIGKRTNLESLPYEYDMINSNIHDLKKKIYNYDHGRGEYSENI